MEYASSPFHRSPLDLRKRIVTCHRFIVLALVCAYLLPAVPPCGRRGDVTLCFFHSSCSSLGRRCMAYWPWLQLSHRRLRTALMPAARAASWTSLPTPRVHPRSSQRLCVHVHKHLRFAAAHHCYPRMMNNYVLRMKTEVMAGKSASVKSPVHFHPWIKWCYSSQLPRARRSP